MQNPQNLHKKQKMYGKYAKFGENTQIKKNEKPEVRKFYEKFTHITEKLRNFMKKIFSFVHQNFEWSTHLWVNPLNRTIFRVRIKSKT